MSARARVVGGLIAMGLLAACNQTTYHQSAAPVPDAAFQGRNVHFQLSRAIYEDMPACVIVLPTEGQGDGALKTELARALSRHMSLKVGRVITPHQMSTLARRNAVNAGSEDGRRHLAAVFRCHHAVLVNLTDADAVFFGVWARNSFSVELRMFRIGDNQTLWQAAHIASRQDGSLPLSPVSIGVGLFKAAAHRDDTDILPSMVDDAVRRMVKTLPDFR